MFLAILTIDLLPLDLNKKLARFTFIVFYLLSWPVINTASITNRACHHHRSLHPV